MIVKKVEGPNKWIFLVRQGPRGSYLGGRPCIVSTKMNCSLERDVQEFTPIWLCSRRGHSSHPLDFGRKFVVRSNGPSFLWGTTAGDIWKLCGHFLLPALEFPAFSEFLDATCFLILFSRDRSRIRIQNTHMIPDFYLSRQVSPLLQQLTRQGIHLSAFLENSTLFRLFVQRPSRHFFLALSSSFYFSMTTQWERPRHKGKDHHDNDMSTTPHHTKPPNRQRRATHDVTGQHTTKKRHTRTRTCTCICMCICTCRCHFLLNSHKKRSLVHVPSMICTVPSLRPSTMVECSILDANADMTNHTARKL